jgi:hypothetical protein
MLTVQGGILKIFAMHTFALLCFLIKWQKNDLLLKKAKKLYFFNLLF